MARKTEETLTCDQCEQEAKSWTITDPKGDRFYVDLCVTHSKGLAFLCGVGKPARKGPFGTRAAMLKAKGQGQG